MIRFSLLICVIVLATVFDFINGFHDTANAIATSVSTRVLSLKVAVAMAAVLNMVGALSGTAVAKTVGVGLVETASVTQVTVISALLAAIIWDIITWYFGLPTSSSHAILYRGSDWRSSREQKLLSKKEFIRILFGLIFFSSCRARNRFLLMLFLMWVFKRSGRRHWFQGSSTGSRLFHRAYMAFSHGSNDAQKTMGIITMALISYKGLSDFHVPFWVIALCAVSMALGTAAGGWRIIKTLGVRLVHLRPINGFAAEASAATIIEIASRIGLPLSTTHIISSTIMGVGRIQEVVGGKVGRRREYNNGMVAFTACCAVFLHGLSAKIAITFI